jgi:hypothetical protein
VVLNGPAELNATLKEGVIQFGGIQVGFCCYTESFFEAGI